MIVLIVGGTGSLAKAALPILLRNPQVERVRLLSRGEHTQMQMWESMDEATKRRVDFFVGDCRDRDRLLHASRDCQVVFHFAAMKSVDKAEYDPWEAVQTNIHGTKNIIEACLQNNVERAIFTSTDKAVAPLNIYGASKLVAEKLFIQSNIGRHRTRFSVMRYGNVFGSNGSVITKWEDSARNSRKPSLTAGEMTRFFILVEDAAQFVVDRAMTCHGGEVFVPKMKSTTMLDLFNAFKSWHGGELSYDETGIRPGEKMHEVLISQDEISLTTDCGDFYIRWPNDNLFPVLRCGAQMQKGFSSYDAKRFTPKELKGLIECQLGSSPMGVKTDQEISLKKTVQNVEKHSSPGHQLKEKHAQSVAP